MNFRVKSFNPIELLRFKQDMSQKDFAEKLGYEKVNDYKHHMNSFTPSILEKVNEIYHVDLKNEVISFLKYRLYQLDKKMKELLRKNSETQKPQDQTESILSRIN